MSLFRGPPARKEPCSSLHTRRSRRCAQHADDERNVERLHAHLADAGDVEGASLVCSVETSNDRERELDGDLRGLLVADSPTRIISGSMRK